MLKRESVLFAFFNFTFFGEGVVAQVSIVTLNDILNHLGYELDMKELNPFMNRE